MKLQINMRGAWRDILSFPVMNIHLARDSARRLFALAEVQHRLRIVMPDGMEVVEYFDMEKGWYLAGRAET